MTAAITAATRLAGVIGDPIRHSLSPVIHNAWLAAVGIDAAYVAVSPAPARFEAFVEGCRGGVLLGLNVTLPFKERALACADSTDAAAQAAGAANLLLFHADGRIEARNTDGLGLIAAFAEQAPHCRLAGAQIAILGAGGAARGAASALTNAGAQVRIFNRTSERAEGIAAALSGVEAFGLDALAEALAEVDVLINAASAGLGGREDIDAPVERMRRGAVVMDMVYSPLRTPLLRRAQANNLDTVDGLAMLIGQARPSFEALFGVAPPAIDMRRIALSALGETV